MVPQTIAGLACNGGMEGPEIRGTGRAGGDAISSGVHEALDGRAGPRRALWARTWVPSVTRFVVPTTPAAFAAALS